MKMTTDLRSVRAMLARNWLRIGMFVAILAVVGTAVSSAALERDAALADFSNEQGAVAAAIAVDFDHRLNLHLSRAKSSGANTSSATLSDDVVLDLLSGARRLEERADGLMVLVARPGRPGFLTTDHRIISSHRLTQALGGEAGDASSFASSTRGARPSPTERAGGQAANVNVILPRDEAVSFGLPPRAAAAGLARVRVDGEPAAWGVVVVASAYRLRTRQRNEQWRLGLTAGVVTLLVLVVGRAAERRERRQLDLEREVAIATLERDREAALAKADKMAALAALSTGIAHEVGTPLSIIVERVDQLRERLASDERAGVILNIVTEQVARIQRIVRSSLALARGDVPLLVHTDPKELADRAIALVRHRFDKANVIVTTNIGAGLPPIACDPSLFEQALVNLLLNACEASSEGGSVTLTVALVENENGNDVELVVEDTGEGISEHAREKATEPFFSTKRTSGGSGLGLTIAREIVLHHSGTLTVEPRRDVKGTRARITIKAV